MPVPAFLSMNLLGLSFLIPSPREGKAGRDLRTAANIMVLEEMHLLQEETNHLWRQLSNQSQTNKQQMRKIKPSTEFLIDFCYTKWPHEDLMCHEEVQERKKF